MGYYRMFLALCVLTSHCVLNPYLDEGRVAVICFFMISGYAMGGLLQNRYGRLSDILPFYADRILRIFPMFLFFAALTVFWIAINPSNVSWHQGCTPELLALNLAIAPLYSSGYPWYVCTLLPQSWSLSLELVFYLFAPLIALTWSRWTIPLLTLGSFYIYGQAFLGIIDTDTHAFRHLPGTLYIFLIGMAFSHDGKFWRNYLIGSWVAAVCVALLILLTPNLRALNSNPEIIMGVVLGIPCLALAKNAASSPREQMLGSMSYAVFLVHFLVICVIEKISTTYGGSPLKGLPLVVSTALVSIPAAYFASVCIDGPVATMRRRLRSTFIRLRAAPATAKSQY